MSTKTGKKALSCACQPSDEPSLAPWQPPADWLTNAIHPEGVQGTLSVEQETGSHQATLEECEPGKEIGRWAGRWI